MSVQTTDNGQIIPRSEKKAAAAGGLSLIDARASRLQKMLPAFKAALPSHLTADRMLRIATSALRTTPKLAETTEASFFGSIIAATQLGLEVNTPTGHAYLIPFEEKKKNRVICQLIIGYKGYIELAYRSGLVHSVRARPVKKGDVFEYEYGLDERLVHKPASGLIEKVSGELLTHVYAIAELKGMGKPFVVLDRAQIERRRARNFFSHNANSPWNKDYEPMALKTGVRALVPWMPQSAELPRAAAIDDAADKGAGQIAAIPEEITDALIAEGMLSPEDMVVETTGETIDGTTGEVKPAAKADRQPGEEG